MKKLMLLLVALTFLGAAAFADHPRATGIGIVGGSNFTDTGLAGDLGLSLKLKDMPIYWGLYLNLTQDFVGLRASGDKYFTDEALLREDGFKLDWYLGVGGYASLGIATDATYAALGLRIPVGLSWHITKEFELWVGIAPSLGLGLSPLNFPDWGIPGELGLRVWLR